MKHTALSIIFICLISGQAHSAFKYPQIAETGKNIQQFVPEGWKIHRPLDGKDIVYGDLNKDGIKDVALVLQHTNKVIEAKLCNENYEPPADYPRILVILLGRKDGSYRLSTRNNKLLFRSNEGGILGDPLENLKIERGTLVTEYYGGSAWRWRITQRFRLENTGWHLIGYTRHDHWTGDPDSSLTEDYNLITGKIEVTKKSGKAKTKKYVVKRKKQQIKLSKTRCWNYKAVDELKVN
ncbi:MAG: hypothetical protein ACRBBN_13640 [Methyloligellaceae bacterium]